VIKHPKTEGNEYVLSTRKIGSERCGRVSKDNMPVECEEKLNKLVLVGVKCIVSVGLTCTDP
jgi:hypothetical protein